MSTKKNEPQVCQICHKSKPMSDLFPAELVRPVMVKYIKSEKPSWDSKGFICLDDLNFYRNQYINHIIKSEKKKTKSLENEVLKSLQEQELLTKNINTEFSSRLSTGDRLADKIAIFGGSWRFIISFAVILFVWIIINSVVLLWKPYDPYPFILLNLILSCLAAIQAPIIMMSQNRQEAKDRIRAENDYKVNLKAELEIRHLHEKIDHLLLNQWQRLLEIQQFQTEIMEEIQQSVSRKKQ